MHVDAMLLSVRVLFARVQRNRRKSRAAQSRGEVGAWIDAWPGSSVVSLDFTFTIDGFTSEPRHIAWRSITFLLFLLERVIDVG